MNEEAMKKIYFAHRKVIKRWESQVEEKPVIFSDGKKVRVDPDIEKEKDAIPEENIMDAAADTTQEVDISNVDDIIKNFVKRPQGSVDDIINSV